MTKFLGIYSSNTISTHYLLLFMYYFYYIYSVPELNRIDNHLSIYRKSYSKKESIPMPLVYKTKGNLGKAPYLINFSYRL